MRLPAAALVLALAACTHGAAPAPRATATRRPAPVTRRVSRPARPRGLYVTTTAIGSDFLWENNPWEPGPMIRTHVPALHGLPPAALRRANAALAAEVEEQWSGTSELDVYGYPGYSRIDVDGELSAVTDRFVTVDLVVTTWRDEGAFYDVDPYVIERATGLRWTIAGLLRDDTGGYAALAAYVNRRLPEVVGEPVRPVPATRLALRRVTPLPEGLEVSIPAWKLGLDHDDPVSVVVPWPVVAPYLAVSPVAGERDPAYRDGRRAREWEVSLLERALGRHATRWEVSQYAAARGWAIGTVGASRAVLRLDDATWRVVERGPRAGCATLPTGVRRSVALRC